MQRTTGVTDIHADVIVIGGGLSGLAAALKLHRKGLKTILLEARDRLGGRTYTKEVILHNQTASVDLGGAYLGSSQWRMMGLVEELGLHLFRSNEDEDCVYLKKNYWTTFHDVFPPPGGLLAWLDVNHLIRLLEDLCTQVPVDKPWTTARAEEWDNMTFQQFIDKNAWTKAGQYVLKDTVQLNICAEPYEVSLLFMLWSLHGAGGVLESNATEGGSQEWKIEGGTQQLSEKMAEIIGKDCIYLNQPVIKVDQTGEDVVVTSLNGSTFKCKHVVVASPVAIQSQITFCPTLPPERIQLIQRSPMGCGMKTFLYYDTPFWKENGLCGSSYVNDHDSLVNYTMDNSNEDGSAPALVAFIVGHKAKLAGQLTREERKSHVMRIFAKIFRSEKALEPTRYEELDWATEQYTGGCYCQFMPPGVLTTYGKTMRDPVGRVYFAGTESASEWMGYMEGALESGERAATQILEERGMYSEADRQEEQRKKSSRMNQYRPAARVQQNFLQRHAPSVPALGTCLALLTAVIAVGVATRIKPKLAMLYFS